MTPRPEPDEVDSSVTVARTIVAGLVGSVLLLALLSALYDPAIGFDVLTAPAALLGLVSPVLGFRIHTTREQEIPAAADSLERRARYLRAIVYPLAVTQGGAMFGVVSFWLGGGVFSLVGVLTHLLLAGALWPSPERLTRFLEGRTGHPGGEPT